MIILVSALLMLAPDETEERVRSWAAKAKPFTQCAVGADCDRKWERAKAWVRDNSRFKIVVDQPGLFSTPGAIYANTDLSFTLTMTAPASGMQNINVFAWCGNVLICKPKPRTAVAALKLAVD